MSKSTVLKIVLLAVLILGPALALAQTPPPASIQVPNVGLPGSANADLKGTIANVIRNYLLPFAGVIAVLFIIIGGYQYMFAGANEDLAERGKGTLKNAILGLIIIILSYVVVTVVINTLLKIN